MQVTIADHSFNVVPEPFEGFWRDMAGGRWEPATLGALRAILRAGDVYIDIGAWIGPTVLYAAALGARVHTYEPDPVALERLRVNLAANPEHDVTLYPVALADIGGTVQLSSPNMGNSMSSMVRRGDPDTVAVAATDVRQAVAAQPFTEAAIVKMDVEGGEYRLLPLMVAYLDRHRPVLLLSTHTNHLIGQVARYPRVVRVPLIRARAALAQLRLLRSLSGLYEHCYLERLGGWRAVSWRRLLVAALRIGGKTVILSPRPLDLP
jgi:FkbM family methyltransferase